METILYISTAMTKLLMLLSLIAIVQCCEMKNTVVQTYNVTTAILQKVFVNTGYILNVLFKDSENSCSMYLWNFHTFLSNELRVSTPNESIRNRQTLQSHIMHKTSLQDPFHIKKICFTFCVITTFQSTDVAVLKKYPIYHKPPLPTCNSHATSHFNPCCNTRVCDQMDSVQSMS